MPRFPRINLFLCAVLCAISFLASTKMAVAEQSVAQRVFIKASPSVFVVEVNDEDQRRQGSAVVYHSFDGRAPDGNSHSPSSLAITNAHVVGRSKEATLINEGRRYLAKVTYVEQALDLARLQIVGVALPHVTISTEELPTGAGVYAIGSPRGLENSLSAGIVSGFRTTRGVTFVQTTAAISPGSSGGGLFDSEGKLVGVTTLKLAESEGLNFAVSARYISELDDVVLAAGLVRFMANIGNLARETKARLESDDFLVWLRTAQFDATSIVDELLETGRRVIRATGKQDETAANEQMSALVARVVSAYNERSRQDEGGVTEEVNQSTAPIHLLCQVDGNSVPAKVDTRAMTVNGWPAKISDSTIEWSTARIRLVINRYAGIITVFAAVDDKSYTKGQHLGTGRCELVRDRKF